MADDSCTGAELLSMRFATTILSTTYNITPTFSVICNPVAICMYRERTDNFQLVACFIFFGGGEGVVCLFVCLYVFFPKNSYCRSSAKIVLNSSACPCYMASTFPAYDKNHSCESFRVTSASLSVFSLAPGLLFYGRERPNTN